MFGFMPQDHDRSRVVCDAIQVAVSDKPRQSEPSRRDPRSREPIDTDCRAVEAYSTAEALVARSASIPPRLNCWPKLLAASNLSA